MRPTDAELVERWRGGDEQACEALFERHYAGVTRFFRNKTRAGCDDLVQSTFLRCFEALRRLRDDVAFRSYLFGIACNTLREHYRGVRREADHRVFDTVSVHDLDPSPSALVARRQEQRLLLEALRRLPLTLQIAIELHYWERMSAREIGEVTNVPLGTAKTRLRRARQLLAERLRELTASPAVLSSTHTDLERWAQELRIELARG